MTHRARSAVPVVAAVLAALLLGACGSSDDTEAVDPGSGSSCRQSIGAPSEQTFDEYPPMEIDESKTYTATVTLAECKTFTMELYPDKAPLAVNSFVFLARKGFFDGVTFHRVLDGFMAQGGDPTGTGGGGPGYEFKNEESDLRFDKAGVVAMANAGPDTNGSQFFITFGPADFLDGGYTIFGQVTEGMDVVDKIKRRDPDQAPDFAGDAIASVEISEK